MPEGFTGDDPVCNSYICKLLSLITALLFTVHDHYHVEAVLLLITANANSTGLKGTMKMLQYFYYICFNSGRPPLLKHDRCCWICILLLFFSLKEKRREEKRREEKRREEKRRRAMAVFYLQW